MKTDSTDVEMWFEVQDFLAIWAEHVSEIKYIEGTSVCRDSLDKTSVIYEFTQPVIFSVLLCFTSSIIVS